MASTLGRSGGRALDAIVLLILITEGWIQQVYFSCIASINVKIFSQKTR